MHPKATQYIVIDKPHNDYLDAVAFWRVRKVTDKKVANMTIETIDVHIDLLDRDASPAGKPGAPPRYQGPAPPEIQPLAQTLQVCQHCGMVSEDAKA